jgi:hypothetical protein
MRIRLRKWLCRKFNLIGAETVITVKFEGSTLLRSDFETLRAFQALKKSGPKLPPHPGLNVLFDWKP